MKKTVLTLVAAVGLMLASCDTESSYHTMGIVYPTQSSVVYADQQVDSIKFYVTDDFRLTPLTSWLSVPDTLREMKVQNVYRVVYELTFPVLFEANTSGDIRHGQLSITSTGADKWDQTATANYTQVPWHNITCPAPAFSYSDRLITGAKFEVTDSATQLTDTLRFTAYDSWTLSNGEFAHPDKSSGTAGKQEVVLAIDENVATTERETSIALESCGVKTPITIKQTGAKL